jgi:ElaB/YqjD/DUF883 family membrane-anchored ribosome-binding protein
VRRPMRPNSPTRSYRSKLRRILPVEINSLRLTFLNEEIMDIENDKYETTKRRIVGVPDENDGSAQSALERGAEAYGQAEKAVSNFYDQTAQAVGETYERAKNYGRKNPDKALLIALGIGVGLGLLLGASSRRSRNGGFAKPVVNALSGIASQLFR